MPESSHWIVEFLAAYLAQAVGYFAVVGLVFLITRRWSAQWLARRRIHTRGRRLDRAQLVHEVRHSLVVLALGSAQALAITRLGSLGLIEMPTELGGWGWGGAALLLVGLIAFNDLWFYAVHRSLHTRWLYKHVHAVHHRSVDVDPLSSYSFHALEAVLITGWVIPVMLVLPLPMPVVMAAQVIGLANNVMAHLGYELLPSGWLRIPLLRWTNTATFHALHHERFTGNFGLFSRVWDRLFGTELDGYEAAFEAAHRAAAERERVEAPAGAS